MAYGVNESTGILHLKNYSNNNKITFEINLIDTFVEPTSCLLLQGFLRECYLLVRQGCAFVEFQRFSCFDFLYFLVSLH